MSAQIIDGRKIAAALKTEVSIEFKELESLGLASGLVTVAVGENFSAQAYQRRIGRAAAELGMPCTHLELAVNSSQDELLAVVAGLNADPDVTGVLFLRPLPAHLSEAQVFAALSPVKDVEAVHPENAGLLALGKPRYIPSTAAATFYLLDQWLEDAGEDLVDFYHHNLIVVVGRSNNVGKPAVSLAYARQASVESIDGWASRTGQLGRHTRRADVLIVAAGVPGLIRSEHIRDGAIVLDIGINLVTDPQTGKVSMVGDVAFDDVLSRARAITPVPGGIGPVTDVWLLRNAVAAARKTDTAPAKSAQRKAGTGSDHLISA